MSAFAGPTLASGEIGVEMEALLAVSVAALTIYDMCKAVDRGMIIENVSWTKSLAAAADIIRGYHRACLHHRLLDSKYPTACPPSRPSRRLTWKEFLMKQVMREQDAVARHWKRLYAPIAAELAAAEELLRGELTSDDLFVDQLVKHAFRMGNGCTSSGAVGRQGHGHDYSRSHRAGHGCRDDPHGNFGAR